MSATSIKPMHMLSEGSSISSAQENKVFDNSKKNISNVSCSLSKTYFRNSILFWELKDKKEWLRPFGLETTELVTLNGEDLLFLFDLKTEAPETFYRLLERKLGEGDIGKLRQASSAISALAIICDRPH